MEGLKELLKKHLGQGYTDELADAIGAEVDTLVDKSFVSRTDFNTKNAELKAIKKQNEDEKLKGATDEDLKKQIEELQKKHETELAEISGKRQNSALTRAIKAAGAKNPKAVRALLDEAKLKYLDDDEDAVEGLKEQLEALTKSDGYLFETPATTAPSGTGFPGVGGTRTADQPTANTDII